jgi:hypothetical protein
MLVDAEEVSERFRSNDNAQYLLVFAGQAGAVYWRYLG